MKEVKNGKVNLKKSEMVEYYWSVMKDSEICEADKNIQIYIDYREQKEKLLLVNQSFR